jgi:hypothetical protein
VAVSRHRHPSHQVLDEARGEAFDERDPGLDAAHGDGRGGDGDAAEPGARIEEGDAEGPVEGVGGEGLLAGIQLAQDKTSKTYFPDTDQPAIFCRDVCQTNGLIVRAVEHALVFCPPLTISHTEVDELAEKTKASLDQTARHFGLA